jgi:phosphoglycerol transferase MdoB-like AlkP superfamily enzyme
MLTRRLGRYSLLAISLAIFLLVSTLTRLVLTVTNLDQVGDAWMGLLLAVPAGLVYDAFIGLCLLLPFGLFLLISSNRFLASRTSHWLIAISTALFTYGILYLSVVEYFFFDEFSARFNSVAVDYLIFPHEVFVNLWDTYPVWQVLSVVLVVSAISTIWLFPMIKGAIATPTSRPRRFLLFGTQLLLVTIGVIGFSAKSTQVSENRVVNELSMNGIYSFVQAALTSELDYDAYYARLDDHTAFAHARHQLAEAGSSFISPDDPHSLDRMVYSSAAPRKLNVVIILEESLGSRFVKSLDPNGPGSASELDKLANDGVLFTNIYATGNRTVRGMEALIASFPPIPGQSVVRRPGGQHIFTLPSLLKAFGYQTSFIYGGYSYFDNMGEFMSSSGCDRVIDRTDLSKKTFTTIWGVCDEDLFDNSLAIFDTMQAAGKPFFSLVLTVSNHSPYAFPDGRIAPGPSENNRENAVRYADYALAKFLRDAESHSFFDSTLFVVLGDHGARVYGAQQIPMDSYRIPVLFYAPKILPRGLRVASLGSQIDVAPTIMGILRESYASEFFGHDLLAEGRPERALMSHNRDVALLRGDHMAVLGLQSSVELWHRDSLTGDFTSMPLDADTSLVNDAIGIYQSAYYLYKNRSLHPLPQPKPVAMRLP